MPEHEQIQAQLKSVTRIVSCELERVEDYLYFLDSLTLELFTQADHTIEDIREWLAEDGFKLGEDGFFLSIPQLNDFRHGRLPVNAVSVSWPPDKIESTTAASHLYILRRIGDILLTMYERLPSSVWMYYQDETNVALQFPYIDQIKAITPDFDWKTYHTYASVCPEANPERIVRWSSPHIDYAGEGLIIAASIPVYISDKFVGLWSIDLQVEKLIRHEILLSFRQKEFKCIVNRDGMLIARNNGASVSSMGRGEKALIKFEDIHECFSDIDIDNLFETKSGFENFTSGHDTFQVHWEIIKSMDWICIVVMSVEDLVSTARAKFQDAFAHLGKGDSESFLKADSFSGEMLELAKSYNEMVVSFGKFRKKLLDKNLELTKQKLKAEMADEAKGLFLSNMSHELRTPLNGIIGMHSLLSGTALDKEQKNYVELASQSARRLTVLLSDILEMSSLESGKARLEEKIFSLKDMFETLKQIFRMPCGEEGLICSFELDENIPELMAGDSVRLSQVLNNLINNAVKFTKEGEIKVAASLLPERRTGYHAILISVGDTGIGIKDEVISGLFKIFTQAEQGYERSYQGAGLGLAVVKELVSMMGGTISVESEPGTGSYFYISLQFKRVAE